MNPFRTRMPILAARAFLLMLLSGCGGGGSASAPVPPPPAPTNVTATPGTGEVTIGWTAAADATSCNIYYLPTPGVTKATGIKLANRVSPSIVTGLTGGTTYYFIVTAVNAGGESVESNPVEATPTLAPPPPPPAPTNVTATPGTGEATIGWTAAADATSCNIYYLPTPGVSKATGIKLANRVSPSIVTGLTGGTTYYFIVTAVNAGGESVESIPVAATPTAPPPPPPPIIAVVSWDAPQSFTDGTPLVLSRDVQGFDIYLRQDPNFGPGDNAVGTAAPAATSFDLTTVYPLERGVTYYVSIRVATVYDTNSDFSPAVPFIVPR